MAGDLRYVHTLKLGIVAFFFSSKWASGSNEDFHFTM